MRRLLALLLLGGCIYDPRLPDGVARCGSSADCPAGYGCYPPPSGAARVCCRAPGCGFPPDAAQPDADPPDAGAPPPDAAPADADALWAPDGADPLAPYDAATQVDLAPDAPAPSSDKVTSCRQRRGGPALVPVTSGDVAYCIDATEVTNAQYTAFLAATKNGSATTGQSKVCDWNGSFLPDSSTRALMAAGREKRAVVGIDWCDAFAFCKWADKRLCGKIRGGPLLTVAQATDRSQGEWVNACAGTADRDFPYGPSYQQHTCNTDAPVEDVKYIEEVGSRKDCQGAFPGVYDLGGNVEEWVDACDGDLGSGDLCASAGPSAFTGDLQPPEYTCPSSIYGSARSHAFKLRGFRCCADP
jgi:sulfatase modifying factor 1